MEVAMKPAPAVAMMSLLLLLSSVAGTLVEAATIQQNDPSITYSGSWYTISNGVFGGGSAVEAMDPGAAATLTFTGTAVSWIGYKDQWSGIAQVYLDGTLVATVDTYAAAQAAQVTVWQTSGLTNATHALRIVSTYTRQASSGGYWIWIDSFQTTTTASTPSSPTLSPDILPSATVGSAYSTTVQASGGQSPYVFSISSGALPAGLTTSSSGSFMSISGTPTAAGTYNFTVQVRDANSQTTAKAYAINVAAGSTGGSGGTTTGATTTVQQNDPLVTYTGTWFTISNSVFAGGSAVQAMDAGNSATLTFTGTGVKWIGFKDAWSGIAQVFLDGALMGTVDSYSSSQQSQVPVWETSGLASASHTLKIVVTYTRNSASGGYWVWIDSFQITNAPGGTPTSSPSFTAASLPAGTAGTAYSSSVNVTGGQAPYSFSITGGSLPSGLTYDVSNCCGITIHGTPTSAGTSNFTVNVSDAAARTAAKAYSITISPAAPPPSSSLPPIKNVFVILEENHNWSDITPQAAPYLRNTLLPMGGHAEQYYNPPGLHPSEPNYIWLEAGSNLGITTNDDPAVNHQSTTDHLVTLLDRAGISWKAYVEDIDGRTCPLQSVNKYAAKHVPFVFFDDVTGTNNPASAYCIAHIRPYSELAADLQNNTVARYNFIVPNLDNDMHDGTIMMADNWLSREVPKILASQAYQSGLLLITWDEGEGVDTARDGPIGLIAISPYAKPNYSNTIHYTHSSTLRTVQEIFGVTPLLRDAANATNLADLFTSTPSNPGSSGSTTTTIQQNDPSITYSGSWFNISNATFNGGSAVEALDAGAAATLTFSGTAVSWLGYKDQWSGIAQVYLDGTLVATVDTYSATQTSQLSVWQTSGLTNSTHTLRIVATHTRNAAANSYWIWLDGFRITK
jgi:phosphatidylinositol-3-phosphatase